MKVIGITGGVGAGKSAILKYISQNYNAEILLADEVAHIVKEPGEICYKPLIELLGEDVLQKNEESDLTDELQTTEKPDRTDESQANDVKESANESQTTKITMKDELQTTKSDIDSNMKQTTDLSSSQDERTENIIENAKQLPKIDRKKMAEKIFSDAVILEKVNQLIHPAVKKYIVDAIERARNEGKLDYFFVEAALLIEDHYDQVVDEMWYIDADPTIRRERLKETRGYSDEKVDAIMATQLSADEYRKHCKVVINNSTTKEAAYEQIDKALA